MGLDMYARSVPASVVGDQQIDVSTPDHCVSVDLAYWRKFNQLHGWMEDLYRQKGGEEEFNCVTVRLDTENLNDLETWLLQGDKTPRPGFFFGSGEIYPEHLASTQTFIQDARSAIAEGHVVLYDSWW